MRKIQEFCENILHVEKNFQQQQNKKLNYHEIKHNDNKTL